MGDVDVRLALKVISLWAQKCRYGRALGVYTAEAFYIVQASFPHYANSQIWSRRIWTDDYILQSGSCVPIFLHTHKYASCYHMLLSGQRPVGVLFPLFDLLPRADRTLGKVSLFY